MSHGKDSCQVFISYSAQNVDFLEVLRSKLKEAGVRIWIDETSIRAGEAWRDSIDLGILNSDIILVLLNKAACASPYVTYEWAFALGKEKMIIPILTEDCDIHPRIAVLQYLDFRNKNRPWDKLIKRINAISPKSRETLKVTDLTLSEFMEILNASKALTSSKEKGIPDDDINLTSIVNELASAKKQLNSIPDDNKTILWVDDIPDNNTYEREIFESLGFTFDLALSTREALSKFAENKYCAIISDMGRVEVKREGFVLLEEIRKIDKATPYFIFAANYRKHINEAREKGVQGATNKTDELLFLVASHVRPRWFS